MRHTETGESERAYASGADYPELLPGAVAPLVERGGTLDTAGAMLLTDRQREIAVLIARGLRNGEIAARLVVTPGTVSNHVHQILVRLGFRSRAQVAAWAARQGLLGGAAG